jgi:hypothetical protein
MKLFRRFRDARFALTTLQNPAIELRTYAELIQAAEQERQDQPSPAQIPATQEQPAPGDSDASANVTSTAPPAPDPLPAALALPADEVELTNHSTPTPRRKRKSKSPRKSKSGTGNTACPEPTRRACATSVTLTETEALDEDDSELTSIERHARKCSICHHPELQSIDEAFLHWRSPQTIMHCFGISSETTIYRHAHAFNFFALRNRNLQSALGNVIEDIDKRVFTGTEMINAVRALAHLNEDGRWISPTSKSEIVYSAQRLPAVAGPHAALPAAQPALPARRQAEPILIGSAPLLENDVNPRKQSPPTHSNRWFFGRFRRQVP